MKALGDGVFAIVLTILLTILLPEDLAGLSLRSALEELRAHAGRLGDQLIVGMCWVAHRGMFSRVRIVDRDVVWLSLLLLMPVSLIPFNRARDQAGRKDRSARFWTRSAKCASNRTP